MRLDALRAQDPVSPGRQFSPSWRLARRDRAAAGSRGTACVGSIERLPKWLLCVPLVAHWFWLGFRYGSATLPSVVNPLIENGGLAGESKFDCLACIGAEHLNYVAHTVAVRPGDDPGVVQRGAGLTFPLIAKPDIGWCGYGVRRIDDSAQLTEYAAAFPPQATYLLQELVGGPGEAGLFYMRSPGAAAGRVGAIALRHQPSVIGDGVRSVRQLAAASLRLAGTDFSGIVALRVPSAGEVVVLATVASLRVGGRYEDGARLACATLSARVDAVARSMGGFSFGRFDVKFASETDLQAGDFKIIEVNGAGSEAIQFWDPALSLFDAFAGVFRNQSELFSLADRWRAQGRHPVGVIRLAKAWLKQQRLISRYPPSN